jgi:hypothetical protein
LLSGISSTINSLFYLENKEKNKAIEKGNNRLKTRETKPKGPTTLPSSVVKKPKRYSFSKKEIQVLQKYNLFANQLIQVKK